MRELNRAGLIGLATAGVGLALAFTQPGASFEERIGLTWLFAVRGPVATPEDVMVAGLDRRSAELLELPEKIRDWPRRLYADLIDRLSEEGASTISFDLIFEREREPGGDAALADAISRAGKVVLFEGLELQRQPTPAAGNLPLGLLETQRLRPPIEAFAEAAAGLGPFPLPIVPDRVSQAWLFQPGAGGRPTLPAVALQQHTLPVFERWLSLLKRACADGAGTLSGDPAALGKAAELREVMIVLRRMFQADQTLGQRLRKAIEAADVDEPTGRLLRALTGLYDGPDSRYLNFYGPAGKITTVSLGDILGEHADPAPGPWAGRSVFVGQSELYEPHNDAFITVYSRDDGVKIGGVEIAATVFANLLDGRMLEPSPYWLASIAVFGLLIGIVAGLLPALWAVPACLLIAGLYFLGAEVAFARDAHWLPTAVPLLAELPLGLFAGLFAQYLSAKRARENLSKAIRYYLPEKLAEGFAAAPLDPLLLNEDCYAYCLITDASGFTRMAEKMTSKELKPVLEDYLGILFAAVENNGGRVTDSVGDGITAAWTSPTPDPDVAAKACKAALEIDREVQRFDQRHAPLSLPTRIGLNAGWVTLGHVGGAGRFTYTVVGDAVNTASRIEQLNKKLGTRILATRGVVEGVSDLGLRPLGRFQLFGKEEVLEMVEVFRTGEAEVNSPRTDMFKVGIKLFKDKKWTKAAKVFAALVEDFDDDASRLYFNACRERITLKDIPITDDVIYLSSK